MKFFLVLISLFLFSCNLHYVKRQDSIKNVRVKIKQGDEYSFLLKKKLEDLFEFYNNQAPEYELRITTSDSIDSSSIGSDAFNTNFEVSLVAQIVLIDLKTNKKTFSSIVVSKINYLAKKDNPVTDFVSQKLAFKNLSSDLSDKIYNKVQEHFSFFADE